jgi:glyoxylase-like metal-dependent hydrolase (beta-lactamase superfamily II)
MHGDDLLLLKRANLYRLVFEAREAIRIPEVTHDLCSLPSVLVVGPFQVSWVPTPGHTPGSVCFRIGDEVFTGDTLLTRRLARMDLPGSDREALRASLTELAKWPAGLTNWPGHGPSASLGDSLALAADLWHRA